MSDIQQRLQKLLDGELDPAEVAEDPALASLAIVLWHSNRAADDNARSKGQNGSLLLAHHKGDHGREARCRAISTFFALRR